MGVRVENITACPLRKGKVTAEIVTCTNANTDYTAAAAIPSWARYAVVYSVAAFVIALGEATSTTVGVGVGAGAPTAFPISPTGVTADDKLHVQSPTAGATVRISYMTDYAG